tara:strand:+ start:106 stop:276 length:171 start_codon:yes stop_codon:yes gene_type:complete
MSLLFEEYLITEFPIDLKQKNKDINLQQKKRNFYPEIKSGSKRTVRISNPDCVAFQ